MWLIRRGDAGGWLAVGFFGPCALLALLVPLATRNHLRLDPDRFTVTTPVLTRSYRWAEVDHFFPVGDGTSGAVAFDLAAAPRRRRAGQRLTRRLFGYDDALPQTYGLPPAHLAALLNRWLARATGAARAPDPGRVVVDQVGVRRRLPDGRQEAVGWDDLVEVAIRTTPEGPWQEDVFFLLTGRHGGVAVPQGEAVGRELLGWLQALPGFDHQQVVEAMGCAEDALFVCWPRAIRTAGQRPLARSLVTVGSPDCDHVGGHSQRDCDHEDPCRFHHTPSRRRMFSPRGSVWCPALPLLISVPSVTGSCCTAPHWCDRRH